MTNICLTFEYQILKTVKIRERSENFHFQGVGITLFGGGQKIFIFKEGDCPNREV